MATPLPPNPFSNLTISHEAFSKCLDLERRREQAQQDGRLSALICARLLGYLLLEAPVETGRDKIALKIMQCVDDASLQVLREMYKDHLIRCCQHQSEMGIDAAYLVQLIRLPSTPSSWNTMEKKLQTSRSHIYLGNSSMRQATKASSIQTIFGEYGGLDATELSNVHDLRNIVSVGSRLFRPFTHLQVWLERDPADPPNVYKLAAVIPQYLNGVLERIEFTTPDSLTLPVPDARYLAVHTACARSAHFSGAAEYIRRILYRMEETDVLPTDGSSDVLYTALIRRLDVEAH
ncbi:hypothetical protein NLJ89_g9227 [Agrocybe chaxingu]|uniref:HNH nuclease domain-containing protein n=1 Tax=Agrocybe chaxingu TaxID=84603 RepID=A0A9W8JTR4_9AGAR|nr:hypothetical protein NLJ89_g9227 [Agrocybe chaxingu]